MEFESENYYTMFCLCILFIISVTDTENIRFVFAAVKDTILQLNLKEYNLVWWIEWLLPTCAAVRILTIDSL